MVRTDAAGSMADGRSYPGAAEARADLMQWAGSIVLLQSALIIAALLKVARLI
jgi:hypothetical protein